MIDRLINMMNHVKLLFDFPILKNVDGTTCPNATTFWAPCLWKSTSMLIRVPLSRRQGAFNVLAIADGRYARGGYRRRIGISATKGMGS